MLRLLKIKNVALIDELSVEFGEGLNLLTGETGSGKSIIVDSLAALTGARVTTDLVKEGETSASIEGLFAIDNGSEVGQILDDAGIVIEDDELIVRREIQQAGRNRIFINGQLTTQAVLRRVGESLVNIHGQGEQSTLYDTSSHIAMLDNFARNDTQLTHVANGYKEWAAVNTELQSLKSDEAAKLQLVDILRFQVSEILRISPAIGEDIELEEEKRRVANAEKLSTLSEDAYRAMYDDSDSTLATLDRGMRAIDELADYDATFSEYKESLSTARAVIEDAAVRARDFRSRLEFSPERLDEVENRLAEITSLKRKYGGTVESVLDHLATSQSRLDNIESSELREAELTRALREKRSVYLEAAQKLHESRVKAAKKFVVAVENNLTDVALEKARFETKINADETAVLPGGIDAVEFYFSANPGEPPRPLAKVASGGEASRLMLILKTAARANEHGKTSVFDEIDIGIGGRVAEAVGRKLKSLAAHQQVLCVTHQPQIASLADEHFIVEKYVVGKTTAVSIHRLSSAERIEEIARMLAGEQITEAARENARTMLAGA